MPDHDQTDNDQPDHNETGDIEAVLREITPEDRDLVAPPDDVWDRIAAELSLGEAEGDAEADAGPVHLAEPERLADVVPIESKRRFTPAVFVGAVAAAVVIVAGIVTGYLGGDDGAAVVANAELAYDAANFDELGAEAEARVSLVEDDGTFRIEIDEADLPTPSDEPADLELWLIEPDAEGNVADLVSLGLVDPSDPASFEVPADYDPDVYFVVDISVEPRDGVPTHSGRSILRGPLQQI